MREGLANANAATTDPAHPESGNEAPPVLRREENHAPDHWKVAPFASILDGLIPCCSRN